MLSIRLLLFIVTEKQKTIEINIGQIDDDDST